MDTIITVDNDIIGEIDDIKDFINSKRPFPIPTLKSLVVAMNNAYSTHNVTTINDDIRETQIVLEGMTIGCQSVKEHFKNINCVDAIYFLTDIANTKGTISEWDIKGLHQLVLRNVDNSNAGRYRDCNVYISGASSTPPDYVVVPDYMQQLVKEYESWQDYHPIVRASLLHGELVKIHPFIDGNGRTSRLLMNIDLMRDGYVPIVITKENRPIYYDSLDRAHSTNDYTDFINLVSISELKMLKRYLEMLDIPVAKEKTLKKC